VKFGQGPNGLIRALGSGRLACQGEFARAKRGEGGREHGERKASRALGCLVLGLFVSVSVLATGAGATSPEAVTILADEFFPAGGTPTITIAATGGVFGVVGSSGTGTTEQRTLGSLTSGSHRRAVQFHGVDVYTTTSGDATRAITFKWQFTCMYTSDVDSVCSGPWHITAGSGDYEGARGGGTAIDECVDEFSGAEYIGTRCSDTLTGKIQVP
jgi:hypothetical protein